MNERTQSRTTRISCRRLGEALAEQAAKSSSANQEAGEGLRRWEQATEAVDRMPPRKARAADEMPALDDQAQPTVATAQPRRDPRHSGHAVDGDRAHARIPIRNLLQLNQGSVVELERWPASHWTCWSTAC
jgi:flagellar motor switch/type III secretory pathway protein FliN